MTMKTIATALTSLALLGAAAVAAPAAHADALVVGKTITVQPAPLQVSPESSPDSYGKA